MEVDHRPGLGAGLEDWIPVPRMDRGQAELARVLAEGDRLEAPLRVFPHHPRSHRRIEEPGDLAGDDALRIWAGPGLEVPLVPRSDRRHRQLGVVDDELQPLTGESGQEGREVD